MITFEQALRAQEIIQQMGLSANVIREHRNPEDKVVPAIQTAVSPLIVGYAFSLVLAEVNDRYFRSPTKSQEAMPTVIESVGRSSIYY